MKGAKRPAIIFGTGALAQVADFYLTADSDYEVVAFTASRDSLSGDEHLGRSLVAFEDVQARYSPADVEMFVAVGYARMNSLRQRFCEEARAKGYRLLTYVCSKATTWGDTVLGDNVFIFEDNTIQPFVSIGSGTVLWSGNHVGHHSRIGDYCFITSHVVVSGQVTVGDRCFIGVNATIIDSMTIGADSLIGAGVVIQRDTEAGEVYLAPRAEKFPKDSSRFFR
jgi:sugar O-acyltransferase (sialic acid O-acetyltransferase NeuD family)